MEAPSMVLPLSPDRWEAFVKKAKEIHPEGEKTFHAIINANENKDDSELDDASAAATTTTKGMAPIKEPVFQTSSSIFEKVANIQKYLNQLQYNHTGTQFFEIKVNRSLSRLCDVAKEIIKYSLPIKCLEAVVLSVYLTSFLPSLVRFTIRFKSKCSQKTHRHIVLGLHYNQRYGALGLSRRDTLMYKPLSYKSLSELIDDFNKSYADCCHKLTKIKMSLPIPTDIYSCDQIHWNYFVLPVAKMSDAERKNAIEKYSRELRARIVS